MALRETLAEVERLAAQHGRHRVQVVAVTKGRSATEVSAQILRAGGAELPLAESRGQELRDKARELAERGERVSAWHFIGPLQRNKIKYLRDVSLVHTVEAAWQAADIARAAEKWGRAPAILLQLHNGETQKHGCPPAELRQLCRSARESGLEVRGLMVMAPQGQPERAAALFAETAQRAHDLGLSELSMGMSGDFPIAIAQGATLLRIGTLLFEGKDNEA